jgi:hypothetical protein
VENELPIGFVIECDHEPLAILVEVDLVLEDTCLLHVLIGCAEDGNQVVHEKDVPEENENDLKH